MFTSARVLLQGKGAVMPVQKLKDFLDANRVQYVSIRHSPAYTSEKIAASAHIPGKELAKTVMVKLDGKMAMAVLPATQRIDVRRLKEASGAKQAELASEHEFASLFPACETGAMPPFGNLYDMQVYVSPSLADDEEIAFNAGSHTELIKMAYADFDRLVGPKVAEITIG